MNNFVAVVDVKNPDGTVETEQEMRAQAENLHEFQRGLVAGIDFGPLFLMEGKRTTALELAGVRLATRYGDTLEGRTLRSVATPDDLPARTVKVHFVLDEGAV
jgi:hypothetical protein